MKIKNIKTNKKYLEEYALICKVTWGEKNGMLSIRMRPRECE